MTIHHSKDKLLHWCFRVAILFKGLDGLFELIGGLLFLFASQPAMTNWVFRVTQSELIEDPDDLLAGSLRHAFAHFSTGSKIFVAVYLLGHGVVKLLLVVGLWLEKHWVFPVSALALLGFIAYQLFKLAHHFSVGLTSLTVLDAVVLGLIWREYRAGIHGAKF